MNKKGDGMSRLEQAKSKEPILTNEKGNKSRVLSLRVNAQIEQALQQQAEKWELSISDTVRAILNFYFLPVSYLKLWNEKAKELEQEDIKTFGESRADKQALTIAERIKPLLVDADEAEEYANFLFELMENNLKAFEALRIEAVLMGAIASEKLLELARAYESIYSVHKKEQPVEEESMVEVLEEMTV